MPEELYYLILTFHWIIISASANERYPLCSSSVAVEGRRSEIICHFDENVATSRTTFFLFKYDNLRVPEMVLRCHWTETGDVQECVTRSGYVFDPFELHTSATITIPYTSSGHAGVYNCHTSKNGVSTSSYNCTMLVVGRINSCTAGRVTEGERSTIACHFNQNLYATKGSFVIRKTNESVHQTVLACNWGKHDGTHVCAQTAGYAVTSDIKGSVAVSIQNTQLDHGGQYRCVTVPESRWVTSEPCNLEVKPVVKETLNASPIDATTPGSQAQNDTLQTLAGARTGGKEEAGMSTGTVVGIVFGVLGTITIAVVVGLLLCRKWQRDSVSRHEDTPLATSSN